MNMKLSRALKIKNRLIHRLRITGHQLHRSILSQPLTQKEIQAHHIQKEIITKDGVIKIPKLRYHGNFKELIQKYTKIVSAIIDVKSAIHIANAQGSQTKNSIAIAENKSFLQFLQELDINESNFGDQFIPILSEKERDDKIASIQKCIEKYQDDIDEYNAVTKIEIDDSIVELLL
ncbi:MAG: hypothetical protein DRN27_05290 [Thermoplasmata archaeon]|nr:MAG: hypothetical protein DRN27_05290 [Thermoplasmata archaeon]